jgi:hypothetical protein
VKLGQRPNGNHGDEDSDDDESERYDDEDDIID